MKSRVIILITIDLLDHYMLNIRRDHTSYIMHALCFNCLLKCPLVNAMTGNISSTILSALRVYELFFPLSFVEGLCKDISVEYIHLHDMRTLFKRQTNTGLLLHVHNLYVSQLSFFFAAKVPFYLLLTLFFFNVYSIHV